MYPLGASPTDNFTSLEVLQDVKQLSNELSGLTNRLWFGKLNCQKVKPANSLQ